MGGYVKIFKNTVFDTDKIAKGFITNCTGKMTICSEIHKLIFGYSMMRTISSKKYGRNITKGVDKRWAEKLRSLAKP